MKKLIITLGIILTSIIATQAQITDALTADTIDLYIVTNATKSITAAQLNTILNHLNDNKLNVRYSLSNYADSVVLNGDSLFLYPLPDEATKVGRIATLLTNGEVEWASPIVIGDTIAEAAYRDSTTISLQRNDEYMGNLTVWYKDLINANKFDLFDNTPVDNACIVFIGDSEVEPFANGVKKLFDEKFDYAGHGYVTMREETYSETLNHPWTLVGNSWTFTADHADTLSWHGQYAENTDNDVDSAIRITNGYFNRLRFHYRQISGGGEFKWKVNHDGDLSGAISTDGATAGKMTVEIDAGADYEPTDTLYIYSNSGTVRLYGVSMWKEYVSGKQTYPVEVHRIFRGGSTLADWNNQNSTVWQLLDTLNPSLIFVNFLENTAAVDDSYRLGLDSLIASIQTVRDSTESNIVITSPQEGTDTTAFKQRTYINDVAEDRAVGHYDFFARFGLYDVANSLGIVSTNHLRYEGVYISGLKLFDLLIPNGYTEKDDYTLSLPETTASDTGVIYLNDYPLIHQYNGEDNIFMGNAGNFTTTGEYLTGIGDLALNGITSGTNNIAIGGNALYGMTNQSNSIGIGRNAGMYATGAYNTIIGSYAGVGVDGSSSGASNVFVGYKAGNGFTTGTDNVFIGEEAGGNAAVTGADNIAIGTQAGQLLTSGRRSVYIGTGAGEGTSTGQYNTIIGFQAGDAGNNSGNTIVGYFSGTSLNGGSQNTFFGTQSGFSCASGDYNVFLGYQAGYNETGSNKLYIDNSNTATPLIYGDFDANYVNIVSKLNIGSSLASPAVELVVAGDADIAGYVTVDSIYHLFGWFGDSTSVFSYSVANTWYHMTNAGQSLWDWSELHGFTESNDTLTVTKTGHYDIQFQTCLLGSPNKQYVFRFYNVTQTAGIPTAAGTEGANTDVVQVVVIAHGELTAGDEIVIQTKNVDGTDQATFKNSAVKMTYLHD